MVLLSSKPGELGSDIVDFKLKATDGNYYSPEDFKEKKILIIVFMCNHCPYVKAVIERIVKIQSDYKEKGVQIIGINSNDSDSYPEDSYDNMKLYFSEWKMNFPYLHDESQLIAKEYDAVCTPDIYVYDQDRKLRYRGRIDDNWKDEKNVTSKDLRNALDTLLENKIPSMEQIPSMGCSIKWKN